LVYPGGQFDRVSVVEQLVSAGKHWAAGRHDALVQSGWYPPGVSSAEGRLRYYAERFPVVEVDST
jgi:hypothetical protein